MTAEGTGMTNGGMVMRERRCSPAPAAEFRRFKTMILLLQNRGLAEKAIDAFIREKILTDLAHEEVKRREPGLN